MIYIDTIRVFISYASKNAAIAEKVCAFLENCGKKCWIAPRDIAAGTEYGEEIIKGIESSNVMVLLFSEDSNKSQHVLREVERAVSKNIPIIAFKIENCTLSKSMEYFLFANQWLDAVSDTEGMLKALDINIDKLMRIKSATGCDSVYPPESTVKVSNKSVPIILGVIAIGIIAVAVVLGITLGGKPQETQQVIAADTVSVSVTTDVTAATTTTVTDEPAAATTEQTTQTTAATQAEQASQPTEAPVTTDAPELTEDTEATEPAEVIEPLDTPAETTAEVPEPVSIEVGSYLSFGSYYPTGYKNDNNDALLNWQVLAVDGNKAKLISTAIIDIKPFDCAESGEYDHDTNGESYDRSKRDSYTDEQMKQFRGSNVWADSDIRAWLNFSGAVKYKSGTPTDKGTDELANGFNTQRGFLKDFTAWQQSLLCDTQTENGVTDKVYLLSRDEVQRYDLELHVDATSSAIASDSSSWYLTYKANGAYDYIWATRTPAEDNAYQLYVVESSLLSDEFSLKNAASSGLGIRPSVTIDLSKLTAANISGDGTWNNQYIITE